MPAFLIE